MQCVLRETYDSNLVEPTKRRNTDAFHMSLHRIKAHKRRCPDKFIEQLWFSEITNGAEFKEIDILLYIRYNCILQTEQYVYVRIVSMFSGSEAKKRVSPADVIACDLSSKYVVLCSIADHNIFWIHFMRGNMNGEAPRKTYSKYCWFGIFNGKYQHWATTVVI